MVLSVMVASPSDVSEARQVIEKALYDWNATSSAGNRGVMLRPWLHETSAVPLAGDHPQAIINSQGLRDADIVFAVFGSRIGSPTPDAISGSVEEVEKAIDAGKPVHIYFSSGPHPNDVDTNQLQALRQFKDQLKNRALLGEFAEASELTQQVNRAIEHDLTQLGLPAVKQSQQSGIKIKVGLEGDLYALTIPDKDWLAESLERASEEYLSVLPPEDGLLSAADGGRIWGDLSVLSYTPEDRKPKEYRRQVQLWKEQCISVWPDAVTQVLQQILRPPRLVIKNEVDVFLDDAELVIRFPEHVQGIESAFTENPLDNDMIPIPRLDLPAPPRLWGPASPTESCARLTHSAMMDVSALAMQSVGTPRVSFANADSLEVTVTIGDVRPRRGCNTVMPLLVIDATGGRKSIRADWTLTAKGRDDVSEGTTDIIVKCLDLTEVLQASLNDYLHHHKRN